MKLTFELGVKHHQNANGNKHLMPFALYSPLNAATLHCFHAEIAHLKHERGRESKIEKKMSQQKSFIKQNLPKVCIAERDL